MTANPSWYPHPTHPHRGILDHRYDDHRGHRWSTECVCGWRSPVEDSRGLAEAGHLLHIAFASGRLARWILTGNPSPLSTRTRPCWNPSTVLGTTLRPAELPGQLDIFGGER